MRKIIFISVFSFIFFLIEFLWFNLLGTWFNPELLILLIIFFDLSLGVRYGLFAAFLGGILKDSFSTYPFGTHLFSFVLCAFMTIVFRRYFFQTSPYSLRILLAFTISFLNAVLLYVLNSIFLPLDLYEAFYFVMVPNVLATTLVAGFTFRHLRKCVLKFCV